MRDPLARGLGAMEPKRARWAAYAVVGALVALALVVPASAHAAARPGTLAVGVLAVVPSPARVTEHATLTVAIELASSANVKQVYFTFCQITYSECYLPITMSPAPGNWYNGTTLPMANYDRMNVGSQAGFNITVVFTDNSTESEPALPNAFPTLPLAQLAGNGEWVFQMQVAPLVFGLSGVVVDAATGAAVAGAQVDVTPGNVTPVTTGASGAFAFSGLTNGSYTISVTRSGYSNASTSVTIAGSNATKEVALSNSSQPTKPPPNVHTQPALALFGTPLGIAAVALPVAVALGVAVALARQSRRKGGGGAEATDAAPGAAESGPGASE